MLGFDRTSISAAEQEADPRVEGMREAVAKAKVNNPFVVFEATGNDLVYAIFDCAKNDDGVHLEKALGIAGALAGFACAMTAGLQDEMVLNTSSKMPRRKRIEHILRDSSSSLWNVLSKKADALGDGTDYDVASAMQRGFDAADAGTTFDPDMPEGHQLSETPLSLVMDHWYEMLPLLNRYDEHFNSWPVSWAAACAQLMEMGKDAIPPSAALQIMMEYAVPMTLIGPSHSVAKRETEAA